MRGRTFGILLLMLLLAVPVVGWLAIRSIDGGYWRGLVAGRVEAATGRKLTVAGPSTVSWSMSPTLSVEQVALANAPGAASPTMVKVGRLELQLRPLVAPGRAPGDRAAVLAQCGAGPRARFEGHRQLAPPTERPTARGVRRRRGPFVPDRARGHDRRQHDSLPQLGLGRDHHDRHWAWALGRYRHRRSQQRLLSRARWTACPPASRAGWSRPRKCFPARWRKPVSTTSGSSSATRRSPAAPT